jgi:hypothetical protein
MQVIVPLFDLNNTHPDDERRQQEGAYDLLSVALLLVLSAVLRLLTQANVIHGSIIQ